jgi:glycerol kinase
MGAAFLAGLQSGFWKTASQIQSLRKVDRIFTPKMQEKERQKLWAGWKWAIAKVLTR